jgi:hypothetical protein
VKKPVSGQFGLCRPSVTIRVAGQRCDVSNELPASGMLHRGGNAHLDAELVRPVRLAMKPLRLWKEEVSVSARCLEMEVSRVEGTSFLNLWLNLAKRSQLGVSAWIKSLQQGARRAVALKHQIFVLEPEHHAAPAAADIFVLV